MLFCRGFSRGRGIEEGDFNVIFANLDALDHGLDDLPLLLEGEIRPIAWKILPTGQYLIARQRIDSEEIDLALQPREFLFHLLLPFL